MERPEKAGGSRTAERKRSSGGGDPKRSDSTRTGPTQGEPSKNGRASEGSESGGGEERGSGEERGNQRDWRKADKRRGSGRRGGRRRRKGGRGGEGPQGGAAGTGATEQGSGEGGAAGRESGGRQDEARGRSSRSRRRANKRPQPAVEAQRKPRGEEALGEVVGLVMIEKQNHAHLRSKDRDYVPDKKNDVHVSPKMVQRFQLRDGCLVKGPYGKGKGKAKFDLLDVIEVDGRPPNQTRDLTVFKKLTSIDPDFHYAMGDLEDDVDLRIVDLICPVGRGQRGLIVAPPRSGKTILLQKMAKAIEHHYPDVHLMVLLADERPEEATEWRRTVERGQVFVSTNDEMARRHVDLAESVWKRCQRMVELGEDVFLVIDSITRLARAYNSLQGAGGRTMSGGVDTRALERPKQFFGSARNTETAGSLTILGTTLIETGSRMDQVIFEEFKGTGNMELVLSRKLADRRIFPAIDIQRSGTRKEEKLISSRRLKLIHTLRRVLMRMSFVEAMELLATKLDDSATTDEFLSRFEIDPEE